MAFIAVSAAADGEQQTLGVVRAVADPDNIDAEFAIVVRSDLKAHGLGQLLLRKMISYLSARGTQRMVGSVMRENGPMLELIRGNGFVTDTANTDADSIGIFLALPA
jgi:acetyltransferase